MFAKGLKNPAFRAYLKAQLDASPYREHKLQFETFLGANGSRALSEIAVENGATKDALETQAKAAIALEVYFPVPAHRAAWTGDEHVLVPPQSRTTIHQSRSIPMAGARCSTRRRRRPSRPGPRAGRNRLLTPPGSRHRMHRRLWGTIGGGTPPPRPHPVCI